MKKSAVLAVLAAVMVVSIVGVAAADSVTYTGSGSPLSASGTVSVSATVNPKLTLTVVTPGAGQTVAFGAIDPATAYTRTVNLSVSSNKTYDLTCGAPTGDVALLGFSTSLTNRTGEPKGTNAYSDTYTVNAPYTTDPGTYGVAVQYTAVQQ